MNFVFWFTILERLWKTAKISKVTGASAQREGWTTVMRRDNTEKFRGEFVKFSQCDLCWLVLSLFPVGRPKDQSTGSRSEGQSLETRSGRRARYIIWRRVKSRDIIIICCMQRHRLIYGSASGSRLRWGRHCSCVLRSIIRSVLCPSY